MPSRRASLSVAPAAVEHEWPGLATPVLVNRPLRPGTDLAGLSRFADDRWWLTPAIFEDHATGKSLNLAGVPGPFQETAKHYLWQQLNHPKPPVLRGQVRPRLAVGTIAHNFQALAAFLHWLAARGIDRLGDVTDQDLDGYLADLLVAPAATRVRAGRINEVRGLWSYRELLPPAGRLPTTPPWQGDDAAAILGRRRHGLENRTPRIHPDTMDRLLCWALRFVELFADDILAAHHEHAMLALRSDRARGRGEWPAPDRGTGGVQRDLHALLERLRASGTPLPGRTLPDGRRMVDWGHLARLLDCWTSSVKRPPARQVLEACGLPIGDAAALQAPILGRLDGVPWRDRPIAYDEAPVLARHLATACFVVIAYLSGMRPGEALSLRRGCVHYDQAAGLWLLVGRHWKGVVDETGSKLAEGRPRTDPWVVVEPVARAVAVLERLHDDPLLFPGTLLVGHRAGITGERRGKARTTPSITNDIARFVTWVNDYCASRGRPELIPPDNDGRVLVPSRLRRTLAWFIVRRPRGLVAGAIQYGHVQVQITLGYSGTYASGFPDEHAFETWLLRLEQLAAAEQRLTAGEHVSGPAARTYRDRTHQASRQFAGRVLASSRQAHDLLANPTLQLYPAKGMTCVFDPAKAKCRLKPVGTDARRTPDLTDCQPGCQNIARTDRDIDQLRSQAVALAELAADPLSPEPRHQRERHELERLRTIIDEHDHTRPRRPPGGQPTGLSGQQEDG
jgi:integrase